MSGWYTGVPLECGSIPAHNLITMYPAFARLAVNLFFDLYFCIYISIYLYIYIFDAPCGFYARSLMVFPLVHTWRPACIFAFDVLCFLYCLTEVSTPS